MKTLSFFVRTLTALVATGSLLAEEGGSGRYAPGALASVYDFPGTVPGGNAVVPQFSYYDGSTGSTRALPIGAQIREDVDVGAFAAVAVLVAGVKQPVAGGAYSFGVVIPWVSVEVSSKKTLGPLSARDVAHADALGDITLLPVLLAWQKGLNQFSAQLSVATPTGEYDKDALANTGKNFWTVMPTVGFNRMNPETGRVFTGYVGMEFNSTNEDTDYKSGETLHFDGTFYQRFAGWGGATWSLGVNAFYFQQITGDSGSGAVLGDNKGQVYGIGPALGWERKNDEGMFTFAELKWVPELGAKNRTKGSTVWLKLGAAW